MVFPVRQEAFALLLLELLHMPARVRAVRPQLPQLRVVEYLGQNPQRPVGLIGRLAQVVMERRDVAPLNVRHPELPIRGSMKILTERRYSSAVLGLQWSGT